MDDDEGVVRNNGNDHNRTHPHFLSYFLPAAAKSKQKKPRLFSFFNAKIPQKLLNEKNSPYRYCFDLSLHELR
jgi:hypothetical protein